MYLYALRCLYTYAGCPRDALRAEIRCLPRRPSSYQETAIAIKRQRLLARVAKFNQKASIFMAGLDLGDSDMPQDDPLFCKEENGEAIDQDIEVLFGQEPGGDECQEGPENLEDELEDGEPEKIKLCLPSSFGVVALREAKLVHLADEEIQLQMGQANDCLEKLRNDLGEKSILYRINKRSSASNRTDTRSKQDIRRVGLKVNKNVRSYHRAFDALSYLDAKDISGKYKRIAHEDLALSKDITEENRFGQSSDVLPWFWRIEGVNQSSSEWNDECEWYLRVFSICINSLFAVLRVSWMKARARYERWREEIEVVKHEMLWTTLWFKYQGKEWERREMEASQPGHRAYSAKQQHLWSSFQRKAEENFQNFLDN